VGCGLLILNGVLDRSGPSGALPSEVLEAQAVFMAKCFGQWGLTPKKFLDGMVPAARLNDREFLGPTGANDVYRSDNRLLRMSTVRIRFDRGTSATIIRPR
jgi:hypothetical protein